MVILPQLVVNKIETLNLLIRDRYSIGVSFFILKKVWLKITILFSLIIYLSIAI